MKAVNIQWDTDRDQELLKELPTEIDIPDGMDDEDEISDYISDGTGIWMDGAKRYYTGKLGID